MTAGVAAAVGTAGLLWSAPSARAADDVTVLATAASGQSVGAPAVVTTPGGVSVASWTWQRPGGSSFVKTLQVARQYGGGGWSRVTLAQGALDRLSDPALTWDAATGRVLLTASANSSADLGGTLGTYLWWSGDQGASWTGPVKVFNYFGVGDAAPDGAGGFYSTSGQTGAQIIHVPASYEMQEVSTSDVMTLSSRLVSRGALGLTTAGAGRVPVFAFYANGPFWAHRGTTNDDAFDTKIFTGGFGSYLGVAGDSTGAGVAISHRPGYASSGPASLYVRSFNPVTGAVGTERRLGSGAGDVSRFELRSLPATGAFAAIWSDSATGDLKLARTQGGIGGSWSTSRILNTDIDKVSYYGALDVSSAWAVGTGNRDSDGRGVIWATRTSAATPDPRLATTGKPTYREATRKVTVHVHLNSAGSFRIRAKVPGRGTTVKAFPVGRAGAHTYRIRLTRKMAARLAARPHADIALTLTFTNRAGSVTRKVTLRR